MGLSRQEYWSGLPCLPPGDLFNPGIELKSLMSPALKAGSLPLALPGKPRHLINCKLFTALLAAMSEKQGSRIQQNSIGHNVLDLDPIPTRKKKSSR